LLGVDDLQLAIRRAVALEQSKPAQAVVQARLVRPIQGVARILFDRVELVEQCHVNHCTLSPPLREP
jgi:hypothetical protein